VTNPELDIGAEDNFRPLAGLAKTESIIRRQRFSSADGLEVIRASDVRPTHVDWLWPNRVAMRAVTLLVGEPGVGKSLWSAHLAARLSRGELGAGWSATLMSSAEDSLATTVIPRLEAQAAGADLNRVFFATQWRDGGARPLTLPDEVGELEERVRQYQARLIIIDPLMARLARQVNSWHDQSVRSALAPLQQLADTNECAVLVIAHLNKGQNTHALQRIGGSIGLAAAARSVLLLGRDPDDPKGERGSQRVLAHVKSNLGPHDPSLRYTIESHAVGTDGRASEERPRC
jgi:RecA-family ATPase